LPDVPSLNADCPAYASPTRNSCAQATDSRTLRPERFNDQLIERAFGNFSFPTDEALLQRPIEHRRQVDQGDVG
jgi:hypothetical protein